MLGLASLVLALALAVVVSLAVGARAIAPADVVQILLQGLGGEDADVIWGQRLPRTLIGLVVGAALGVAGALTQAVTRNPLAEPGLLGVNAGAAFALALGTGALGLTGAAPTLALAYAGAVVASVLVFAIGSLGRDDPVRLVLAGMALAAVLAGTVRAVILSDRQRFAQMTAWESGSLVDRDVSMLVVAAPVVAIGVVVALVIASSLNALAMGDDLASALGASVLRTRIVAVVAITILAGTATALAGPILFVGLMIPHAVRMIVGPDQRWIIAYAVVAGPTLVLAADVLGRVVAPPGELPAGIVTAALGAPVLIALVRRRGAGRR